MAGKSFLVVMRNGTSYHIDYPEWSFSEATYRRVGFAALTGETTIVLPSLLSRLFHSPTREILRRLRQQGVQLVPAKVARFRTNPRAITRHKPDRTGYNSNTPKDDGSSGFYSGLMVGALVESALSESDRTGQDHD